MGISANGHERGTVEFIKKLEALQAPRKKIEKKLSREGWNPPPPVWNREENRQKKCARGWG